MFCRRLALVIAVGVLCSLLTLVSYGAPAPGDCTTGSFPDFISKANCPGPGSY